MTYDRLLPNGCDVVDSSKCRNLAKLIDEGPSREDLISNHRSKHNRNLSTSSVDRMNKTKNVKLVLKKNNLINKK